MKDDKNTILIIEDDEDIRTTLNLFLSGEGFNIEEAENGLIGVDKMNDSVDLVILDIMMPEKDGFEVCSEIRKKYVVPILFLTAKSSKEDIVTGLGLGADGYIVKPFSYYELLSRVNAMLRRTQVYDQQISLIQPSWKQVGELSVNMNGNNVKVNNTEVVFTGIEYAILRLLISNPDTVFSSQDIYESVWQERYYSENANTIMVHIRNIRAKLEKESVKQKYIVTVWGKGYRFV